MAFLGAFGDDPLCPSCTVLDRFLGLRESVPELSLLISCTAGAPLCVCAKGIIEKSSKAQRIPEDTGTLHQLSLLCDF